jgi:transposase
VERACVVKSNLPDIRLASYSSWQSRFFPAVDLKRRWRTSKMQLTGFGQMDMGGNPLPHDERLYRTRNIVERFFCTVKNVRRLTSRYENLSTNFLTMVYIIAVRLWIN